MKRDAGFPQMAPISIDEILMRSMSPVNLYVQLSDSRFVLVGKAGATTAALTRYKDRNIHYLYVRQTDFAILLASSISIAETVIRNPAAPDQAMMLALEPALSALYSEFSACGFNDASLAHSKLVSETTLLLCGTDPQFHKILQSLLQMRSEVQKHALLVSALSSMIGMALGWTTPSTLEKLALGGLLHDIGELKLPIEIVDKPLANMSKDEVTIYRSHAELGHQTAGLLRSLPSDVALMIYEHHELADGTGYPRGLRDLLTSPMGRVAIVANAFAELVIRDGGVRPHLVDHAFSIMTGRDAHLYSREVIRALGKIRDEANGQKVA
jgi:putative nucleotidyltransferase with HDIG domain